MAYSGFGFLELSGFFSPGIFWDPGLAKSVTVEPAEGWLYCFLVLSPNPLVLDSVDLIKVIDKQVPISVGILLWCHNCSTGKFASYSSQLLFVSLFHGHILEHFFLRFPRMFKLPFPASSMPSSLLMSISSCGLVSLGWTFAFWASSSSHPCQNFPFFCLII